MQYFSNTCTNEGSHSGAYFPAALATLSTIAAAMNPVFVYSLFLILCPGTRVAVSPAGLFFCVQNDWASRIPHDMAIASPTAT